MSTDAHPAQPQIEATRLPIKRLLHPFPEARELLGGICHSNIYEIIKRGDLKIVKIGKRSFVTDDEIRRYVAWLAGSKGDAA